MVDSLVSIMAPVGCSPPPPLTINHYPLFFFLLHITDAQRPVYMHVCASAQGLVDCSPQGLSPSIALSSRPMLVHNSTSGRTLAWRRCQRGQPWLFLRAWAGGTTPPAPPPAALSALPHCDFELATCPPTVTTLQCTVAVPRRGRDDLRGGASVGRLRPSAGQCAVGTLAQGPSPPAALSVFVSCNFESVLARVTLPMRAVRGHWAERRALMSLAAPAPWPCCHAS